MIFPSDLILILRVNKLVQKRKGKKTFRERQEEFSERNRLNKEKLNKQAAPSFKPKINQKSRMLSKKVKSSISQQKSEIEKRKQAFKNNSPSKNLKDSIACLLNYDLTEVEEDNNSNTYGSHTKIN